MTVPARYQPLVDLAVAWVTDTDAVANDTAQSTMRQLRPDLSPMLRMALFDALGWAARSGGDVNAALDALLTNAPYTPDETTTSAKEAA